MKHRLALTILTLALATIISGQDARTHAGSIDYFSGEGPAPMKHDLEVTLAEGVVPVLEGAAYADGEVTDPAGIQALSTVYAVPVIDSVTGKRGYFMSISVHSVEGERLFGTDLTVFDQECSCLSGNPEQDAPLATSRWNVSSESIATDAKMIRDWIKAKNWTAIDKWVAQQIKKGIAKAIIEAAVKKGFELTGHTCPNLPWYVPFKAYIYMLTCYKTAS